MGAPSSLHLDALQLRLLRLRRVACVRLCCKAPQAQNRRTLHARMLPQATATAAKALFASCPKGSIATQMRKIRADVKSGLTVLATCSTATAASISATSARAKIHLRCVHFPCNAFASRRSSTSLLAPSTPRWTWHSSTATTTTKKPCRPWSHPRRLA